MILSVSGLNTGWAPQHAVYVESSYFLFPRRAEGLRSIHAREMMLLPRSKGRQAPRSSGSAQQDEPQRSLNFYRTASLDNLVPIKPPALPSHTRSDGGIVTLQHLAARHQLQLLQRLSSKGRKRLSLSPSGLATISNASNAVTPCSTAGTPVRLHGSLDDQTEKAVPTGEGDEDGVDVGSVAGSSSGASLVSDPAVWVEDGNGSSRAAGDAGLTLRATTSDLKGLFPASPASTQLATRRSNQHKHAPRRSLQIAVGDEDDIEGSPSSQGTAVAIGSPLGDFVFQPSPAVKAARAMGREETVDGEGEAERRMVYSGAAGSFDLGGFTIDSNGLVSSPRNRGRRRPSLNEGQNFIILARLGSGSSSSVNKALHVPTMRLVALKALPLYDAERRAQMMRELRILYSNLACITPNPPVSHGTAPEARQPAPAAGQTQKSKWNGALVGWRGRMAKFTGRFARLRFGGDAGDLKGKKKAPLAAPGAGGPDRREDDEELNETGQCPYIVSFYDAFADTRSGCLNLVEEYMDGGSLEDLVQAGGCAHEGVLANIAYNVLQGLRYLHDRKLIHRDIKAANLLMNTRGLVKIADFGVSRSLDCGGEDLADTFIGTLRYMSPERITGQEYSYGADIWSFGLSIMSVALGAFPLNPSSGGGGYWGMVHAVCDNPTPELPGNFSETFRHFTSRCLAKDPAKRSSARELLQHAFIANRPVMPVDAQGRLAEFPEHHKVKQVELEQICRALAAHFKKRRKPESSGSLSVSGGLLSTSSRSSSSSSACSPLGCSGVESLPPLDYMVTRLADELGLEQGVVADRLKTELRGLMGDPVS